MATVVHQLALFSSIFKNIPGFKLATFKSAIILLIFSFSQTRCALLFTSHFVINSFFGRVLSRLPDRGLMLITGLCHDNKLSAHTFTFFHKLLFYSSRFKILTDRCMKKKYDCDKVS